MQSGIESLPSDDEFTLSEDDKPGTQTSEVHKPQQQQTQFTKHLRVEQQHTAVQSNHYPGQFQQPQWHGQWQPQTCDTNIMSLKTQL